MEQVQVKIKGTVTTARYGSLTAGAILRTDAAFAKHLVEDCGAAEYVGKSSGPAADPAAKSPAATQAAGRKKINK